MEENGWKNTQWHTHKCVCTHTNTNSPLGKCVRANYKLICNSIAVSSQTGLSPCVEPSPHPQHWVLHPQQTNDKRHSSPSQWAGRQYSSSVNTHRWCFYQTLMEDSIIDLKHIGQREKDMQQINCPPKNWNLCQTLKGFSLNSQILLHVSLLWHDNNSKQTPLCMN